MKNVLTVALSFTLVTAGPALAQGGVAMTDVHKVELAKVTAAVEAVDLKNRILVVKTPRAVSAVTVDKSVKGLEKVKPGQTVELDFYASVGNVVKTSDGEPVRTRSSPANEPGIAALRKINTVTDVYAVYEDSKTVLVRGPLGHITEVQVADVAVLHELKPGTRIELDYIEGVAMAIRPVSKQK